MGRDTGYFRAKYQIGQTIRPEPRADTDYRHEPAAEEFYSSDQDDADAEFVRDTFGESRGGVFRRRALLPRVFHPYMLQVSDVSDPGGCRCHVPAETPPATSNPKRRMALAQSMRFPQTTCSVTSAALTTERCRMTVTWRGAMSVDMSLPLWTTKAPITSDGSSPVRRERATPAVGVAAACTLISYHPKMQ
ncbi:hypothetical protein BBBOND_0304990 [Babesia bigemina]|uniref:Uncharacterized protein n=1 Tax=Babesia bigemina TaxID=5866 RepID=A0A061D7A9_BABBI|nr:hypothetical protein BBBOND_0304990 [Babesia bigemina]CDR96596.1 hypothetical protein BBBOND_0304990 [Babesia bigemina]|eukprot:XP_012768782.1 hypothetical protein BBBOND_0304990 [Babesia bigemina]